MVQAPALTAAPILKTEVGFAGFWRRLLAHLIDTTLILGVDFGVYSGVHMFASDNVDALTNIAPVCSALAWAYYVVMESSPARGTLGKLALGLYVGDAQGDPITFRRAAMRNALKIFSTLLCGVGWL